MPSIRTPDPRWLALAGGLTFALAVTLIGTQADTDPVGVHYAGFNRILTVALALLAVSAVTVRTRVAHSGLPGRRAATALAIGFAVMALGSLVEFWGALIAGQPVEAIAERTGADHFVGSPIGFAIFLLGAVVQFVSALLLARAIRRWPQAQGRTALAAAGTALLVFAATWLWGVSALAAAVPGVLFAFAWLAVDAGAGAAGGVRAGDAATRVHGSAAQVPQ